MVQSKADRERQKLITDKCQSLIEVLLKDDDNKYCVDCDAKGPRWASWNLGVFLCIRCAGIHRNLGVHISKVKSVSLDAWAPEHVAYVQRMGNSRARAIYEANLPDDFRRPQTEAALESFIRAKYELKKYIAQDYTDPGRPEPAFSVEQELKKMKEQKRSKLSLSSSVVRSVPVAADVPTNPKPRPTTANSASKANMSSSIAPTTTAAATTIGSPSDVTTPAPKSYGLLDIENLVISPNPTSASSLTAANNTFVDFEAFTSQLQPQLQPKLQLQSQPKPTPPPPAAASKPPETSDLISF